MVQPLGHGHARFEPKGMAGEGDIRGGVNDVAGTPIKTPNYVIFDSRGNLWCTVSTRRGRVPDWLDGTPDGFIFRVSPSGDAAIVADGLRRAEDRA